MIGQPGVRWLAALVGLGLACGPGVRADEPVQAPGRAKAAALPLEK